MLNGDSNDIGQKKSIGLRNQKKTFHVQHTFLYISLQLICMTTIRKFLAARFMEEISYVVKKIVLFFLSLPLIFIFLQDSKLTLANSQSASDFDNVRLRKISTNKLLRVRIIHVCQDNDKGDQNII